ncbi:MAG TPA: DUF5132 domain-containing protein [Cyanobacteria bacterium UBA11369]|nr:DUF5132 domain-containing protein [Cyanobacteria bacterium UBA11371]HBE36969.1 DUF5132 domain-containing protein [Cyanobacteria bacterium UBA11368]HBE52172.1 DUF5132 domain-containing protein [Cyanobacteria bacterium UBA11369]
MAFKPVELVEDMGAPGIVAGVGAIFLAPLLIPAVAKIGKPIAKTIIKGGIVAYEKSKGAFAEAGEVFGDIVAEAKSELALDEQKALETNSHPEAPNT